jgi:hypothetical protein
MIYKRLWLIYFLFWEYYNIIDWIFFGKDNIIDWIKKNYINLSKFSFNTIFKFHQIRRFLLLEEIWIYSYKLFICLVHFLFSHFFLLQKSIVFLLKLHMYRLGSLLLLFSVTYFFFFFFFNSIQSLSLSSFVVVSIGH